MTATGHALVGAAIAAKVANPYIGIPLAIASHFVCDKVPHWDAMVEKKKTKRAIIFQTVVDVVVSYLAVWLVFGYLFPTGNMVYLFVMAFAAQLPDWLELPHFLLGIPIPFVKLNYKFQSWVHDLWFDSRLAAPWGFVTQGVVALLFVFWSLT